jgi:hypothetical protein
MVSSLLQDLSDKKKTWVIVPLVSFAGIIVGYIFDGNPVLGYLGIAGCIISSFILGGMAYVNEKKDIVALLAPLYAIIIFNPWSEYNTGYVMQALYSLTILVVTVRFVLRFYSE